jgi:hypothetical protein
MTDDKVIKEMSKLYNKATSYLSDHTLEFTELFDLFCSDPINQMIKEEGAGVDGGLIYETVINAFEHKYKAIFRILGEEGAADGEKRVDDLKNLDYLSLFIKLIDDKEISPRELYMLENATKKIPSVEKYNIISNIVNYLSDIDQMHKLKGSMPGFSELQKLREKYGLGKVQAMKIESYVVLGGLKK